jgi:hypothetical protein
MPRYRFTDTPINMRTGRPSCTKPAAKSFKLEDSLEDYATLAQEARRRRRPITLAMMNALNRAFWKERTQ